MIGTGLTRLSGGIGSTDREELCMLIEYSVEQSTCAGGGEEVTATWSRAASVACSLIIAASHQIDARR